MSEFPLREFSHFSPSMSNHRASRRIILQAHAHTLRLRGIAPPNTNQNKKRPYAGGAPTRRAKCASHKPRDLRSARAGALPRTPTPYRGRTRAQERRPPNKSAKVRVAHSSSLEKLRVGRADPSALTSPREVYTLWPYNIFPVFAPRCPICPYNMPLCITI